MTTDEFMTTGHQRHAMALATCQAQAARLAAAKARGDAGEIEQAQQVFDAFALAGAALVAKDYLSAWGMTCPELTGAVAAWLDAIGANNLMTVEIVAGIVAQAGAQDARG